MKAIIINQDRIYEKHYFIIRFESSLKGKEGFKEKVSHHAFKENKNCLK